MVVDIEHHDWSGGFVITAWRDPTYGVVHQMPLLFAKGSGTKLDLLMTAEELGVRHQN